MSGLGEFAARQVLDRQAQLAPPPRPADCLLVQELASVCVGRAAGLAPRDFLVELDGRRGATLGQELSAHAGDEHEWVFYARARHERIALRTTGIDLGIGVSPTPEAVKAAFDAKRPDLSALEVLWEARDGRALEMLSRGVLEAGERDTPALVFLGAALYEGGKRPEGADLVREYATRYAPHWTMNFNAVALHYLGREAIDRGDPGRGLELLQASYAKHPFERTAQAIERAGGRRPPKPQPAWVGRAFPLGYRLPLLESEQPGSVELASALSALEPGQLQLVCLLDGYRGNGPYDSFMTRFRAFVRWFAPYLHGLHVVTEEAQRPAERDFYFLSEDEARRERLPFVVLHDASGEVGAAIEPSGSPHVLALDRHGVVHAEGELSGPELWNALARAEGAA